MIGRTMEEILEDERRKWREALQELDDRVDILEEQLDDLSASLHSPPEREFHEDLLGLD